MKVCWWARRPNELSSLRGAKIWMTLCRSPKCILLTLKSNVVSLLPSEGGGVGIRQLS